MFPSHAAFRKLSLSHTLFWSSSALHFVILKLSNIHWFHIEGSFLFWSTLFLSQHGLYLLTLSISFLSALHLRLLWSDINRLPDRQSSMLTNPHTGLNSFHSCHANCICSCELLVHWFNHMITYRLWPYSTFPCNYLYFLKLLTSYLATSLYHRRRCSNFDPTSKSNYAWV